MYVYMCLYTIIPIEWAIFWLSEDANKAFKYVPFISKNKVDQKSEEIF